MFRTASEPRPGDIVANRTVIFLHIAKTGGSTLSNVLRRQYSPQVCYDHVRHPGGKRPLDDLPLEDRTRLRCMLGHYFFGIHDALPQPAAYVTMLREPVERVLSMYSYLRTNSRKAWMRNATLAEFLERHRPATNFQTAQICGSREAPNLERAKENLRSFAAVGTTERFDESLRLFQGVFGWDDVCFEPANVTPERVRREDLKTHEIGMIEERNCLDAELYSLADELLKARM